MADIQFMRNKKYGTMGTNKNGWTKEVCNVSWNQKPPKLDIREWSPDYRKMSRGITLTKQEAKRLLAILATIDFEEFDALGARPDAPMQVRPVYQNVAPQSTAPIAPAAAPVATAPQTIVVAAPEIVSMPEDMNIPDDFIEEKVASEMQDNEMEDSAELQSMAMPVTAI